MLHNYFKIAWRNLLKRKFYAIVMIFGLSVGMTFTFLMMSYVLGESQVNSDLRNADNQYIALSKWKNPDMGMELTTIGPFVKTLKTEYPNLVAGYYRYDAISVAVSKGDKHFREDVRTGDSTLLSMYGFPVLHGNAATAMQAPNSIVITEGKAMKYFGKTDVIGENLTLHNFQGGRQEYQVTAVLKQLSNNSVTHLLPNQAEIYIPLSSLEGRTGLEENWGFAYMVSFIQLRPGVNVKDLEKPIAKILAANAPPNFQGNLKIALASLKDYYREANNGLVRKMTLLLSGVTIFILLMAVVNFVNISIGNSSGRLKEIGVRKVLGSLKRQLIGQFIAESVLLATLAAILSIGFYEVFRTYFENLIGKPVAPVWTLFPYSLAFPLLISLVIGLLAGTYPAFILSSLPSVDSLRGKLKSVKDNVFFRRALIVSQFSIALFVFAAAAVVSQQVDYFFNKDLGFQKDALVSLPVPRDWTPEGVIKMEGIRDEMSHLKEVNEVTLSYEVPNGNSGGGAGMYKLGQDSTSAIYTQILTTDEKYARTYRINMSAGKFFHADQGSFQTNTIVINQAAANALGYPNAEDAIGKQVRLYFSPDPFTISGVSKNFHFESMHNVIKPLAFLQIHGGGNYRYLSFRLNPSNIGQSMQVLERKWRELMPDAPFEYTFLDDTLQKMYQSEMQMKKAANIATVLAIVVVLLGLLGMVSLNVSRRTREVGIRKVLGASGVSVVMLFLKEFLIVMLVAVLIAFPLVVVAMNKWLQSYAYRITIDWVTFAWIGLCFGLMITVLVFMQTYKTALMNPVKSLKGE